MNVCGRVYRGLLCRNSVGLSPEANLPSCPPWIIARSAGARMVFLNRSAGYAIDQLGVKAKNVVSGVSDRDFYSPGSLLKVQLDGQHPLCYGLPAEIPIWSEGSPAWETEEKTVARYPDSRILASGWLLGEAVIAKRSALVDAKIGQGHAILFGMRPQYRAQSYLTFKLFFNALLYH